MEVRNFGCLAFWAVLAVRLAEGIPTKLLIYICRYLLYHISYVSFVSGTALVLRRLTLVGDVFSSMCTAAVRCWLLGTVDCIVVIQPSAAHQGERSWSDPPGARPQNNLAKGSSKAVTDTWHMYVH